MYIASSNTLLARKPRARKVLLGLLLFPTICLLVLWNTDILSGPKSTVSSYGRIQEVKTGHGGKWHIPRTWTDKDSSVPGCDGNTKTDILHAADCALRLARANDAYMENTEIPLITHQTSRSADPETWPEIVRSCVERWLEAAMSWDDSSSAEMAWFMWDDEGLDALVQKYESDSYPAFASLPYPVEKADAFRVLVLKWFGGIYGDIDSKPLKHPSRWVAPSDVEDWVDEAGHKHTQHSTPPKEGSSKETINAIFGIEADNPPEPDDTYWRMGYTYPVQLTNWALAMSPHHPIADRFWTNLTTRIQTDVKILPHIDPLDITGPPALTRVVKEYAESIEPGGFSWQSLSSRRETPEEARAKIITGDVLILPITGFSPGRGWFRNMGSKPTSHPSARLQHLAAGSWRKPDPKVAYGKFCRTVFGLCREWSKIPEPKRG